MMDALTKSLSDSRAFENTIRAYVSQRKNTLVENALVTSDPLGLFGNAGVQKKYNQFEGWAYSAIHALALEGAGQPVKVGLLVGAEEMEDDERRMRRLAIKSKVPATLWQKSPQTEWEILESGPLVETLEKPNPLQGRWQFVYTIIANLNLTGIAYIVGSVNKEGKFEVFSLPTSWVTPVTKKNKGNVETEYLVGDPTNPKERIPLPSQNVVFIKLPNPANPLIQLAPLASQGPAVRIDQQIQYSQERFFENGIFPSVALTVGKDPHPDVPGGIRPRLNAAQRRQVYAAIEKSATGYQNYGKAIILDGLIESIQRLSATSNEMGWEKSEEKVRTRILSAFGVHPFILGEPVSVGGYAQAVEIRNVFNRRVNTFLDLASSAVTDLYHQVVQPAEKLYVWWEPCVYKEPQIVSNELRDAYKMGVIDKNEYRAELGFSAVDETEAKWSRLFSSPVTVNSIITLLTNVGNGSIPAGSAAKLLSLFLQIEEAEAEAIVGGQSESSLLAESVDALRTAVAAVGVPPKLIASVLDQAARASS